MNSIAIIGCGNIGSAIAFAILNKKIVENHNLIIAESFPNQATKDLSGMNCAVYTKISEIKTVPDLIIIAVKPQNAPRMYMDLSQKMGPETLVLSIMAGVSTQELSEVLATKNIIRCMPNTPCSIFLGMTVFYATESVSEIKIQEAETVFAALGKSTQVRDENLMNAATAINGSGPAYIFYLAEALMEGAMEMGFAHDQSKLLATQTILGAAGLLDKSSYTPQELRKQVSSPGGTTEAAMRLYTKQNLKKKMIDGYQAAYKRSIELGCVKN
ncbi:MAG: pyrroline-5-carboxylate reductase [Deltaproteobacteria bacterium]|jgi:pyrroline-5-carboxylate reductase|nr:pyrroline-5-carboxylate reductase [Deltaproteobacteria bacterium]MBT4526248.1 pyrroline-5-carboxylate reductase [Deltaproteobacteria bacterium]